MTTVFGPSSAANTPIGMINRLYNGDFTLNPDGTVTVGDGATVFNDWYVLTQSGNLTVSQLSYPEPGQYACARFLQASATAQRYGFAQIVQPEDCGDLRTALLNASARLRFSADGNLRWAVLSSVSGTLDVVNDWTSEGYIPGQFFISGVDVVNQGVFRTSAGVWGDIPQIPYQAPDDMVYLYLFVWTQDTVAQNGTLDAGLCQIAAGVVTQPYEHRPYDLAAAIEFTPSVAWGEVITQPTIGEGTALIDAGNPFTDIASATTTTLAGVASDKLRVTGTTTITSFGSASAGIRKVLRFAGALTITNNNTSLICPGGVDLATFAGFTAEAVSLGSGNWIVTAPAAALATGSTTARSLNRRFGDIINAKDFGAVGDGATNDTTAIQAAVNAANTIFVATGVAVAVYFPRGLYMTNKITLKSGVTLVGDGRQVSTLKLRDSVNDDLIYGEGAAALWGTGSSGGIEQYGLINITLDGNRANQLAGSALAIYGQEPIFENLYIKESYEYGLRNEWGTASARTPWGGQGILFNVIVDRCGKHGVWWAGPHDTRMQNVDVIDAGQLSSGSFDGFHFTGTANCRLAQCHASSWMYDEVGALTPRMRRAFYTEVDGIDVTTSHFEGATEACCMINADYCSFDPSCKYYAAWEGRTLTIRGNLNNVNGMILGPGPGRPNAVGLTIGQSGDAPLYNKVDLLMVGQHAGTVDWTYSGGGNTVYVRGYSEGVLFMIGSPAAGDNPDIIIGGSGGGSLRQEPESIKMQSGHFLDSATSGLTAAGSNQGDALALSEDVGLNVVTTTASGTGVRLPAAVTGMAYFVYNQGANTLSVYPAVGGQIDVLGTNNPYSLATTKRALFYCASTGTWASLLGA